MILNCNCKVYLCPTKISNLHQAVVGQPSVSPILILREIVLPSLPLLALTYLVAVSSRGAIDIYIWSGISLFETYDSLPLKDVDSVHPFVLWGDLHMAIARPAYHSVVTMETKSFIKAVIRGESPHCQNF